MKKLLVVLLLTALSMGVRADDKAIAASAPAAQSAQLDEANLQTHKHYVNKDGQVVHSPSVTKSGDAPAGATAKCRDGTYMRYSIFCEDWVSSTCDCTSIDFCSSSKIHKERPA